jgi:hypothetical protein
MHSTKTRGEPQQTTAHIVRVSTGERYQVWLELRRIGSTESLSAARKLAARTEATELCECWDTGKAFERTKRGAWTIFRAPKSEG